MPENLDAAFRHFEPEELFPENHNQDSGEDPDKIDNDSVRDTKEKENRAVLAVEASKYPELFAIFASLNEEEQEKILAELGEVSQRLQDSTLTIEERLSYSETFVNALQFMLRVRQGEEDLEVITDDGRTKKVKARKPKDPRKQTRFKSRQ